MDTVESRRLILRFFWFTSLLNVICSLVYQLLTEVSRDWLPIAWIASVLSVLLSLLYFAIREDSFPKQKNLGIAMSFFLNLLVIVSLVLSESIELQWLILPYVLLTLIAVLEVKYSWCTRKTEYTKLTPNPLLVKMKLAREKRFIF